MQSACVASEQIADTTADGRNRTVPWVVHDQAALCHTTAADAITIDSLVAQNGIVKNMGKSSCVIMKCDHGTEFLIFTQTEQGLQLAQTDGAFADSKSFP